MIPLKIISKQIKNDQYSIANVVVDDGDQAYEIPGKSHSVASPSAQAFIGIKPTHKLFRTNLYIPVKKLPPPG